MHFPVPDDLGDLPVWKNYLFGQMVVASMGLMSPRIVFAGVKGDGTDVTLHFVMDPPLREGYPEVTEIVGRFDVLTGERLQLSVKVEEWRVGDVDSSVDWSYQRYIGDDAII